MLDTGFLPLAGDGVVAVLLIVMIAYVARLNGRLAALRADRQALAEVIAGFQTASQQAEQAVAGLRLSAAESGRDLAEMIERGSALREDLAFLIGKGDTIADKLHGAVRPRKDSPSAVKPDAETPEAAEPRVAQSRLASLLRQTAASERPLDRVSDRAEPKLRVAAPTSTAAAGEDDSALSKSPRQSRSERELQRALLGRR